MSGSDRVIAKGLARSKFFLGRVTNGDGETRESSGYITYGPTSDPDDELGEIEVTGVGAAALAERICKLLNAA